MILSTGCIMIKADKRKKEKKNILRNQAIQKLTLIY